MKLETQRKAAPCDADLAPWQCGKPAGHSGPHERAHTCQWPGCDEHVPLIAWGCSEHWFRLPQRFRTRLWNASRMGNDAKPSAGATELADEIRQWIASHSS